MGFFDSIAKVVTAPLTIPAKVASNVLAPVADAMGGIPVVGNLVTGAQQGLGVLDDIRRKGFDDPVVRDRLGRTIQTGAVVGGIVAGGPIGYGIAASSALGGGIDAGKALLAAGVAPEVAHQFAGVKINAPPMDPPQPSTTNPFVYTQGDMATNSSGYDASYILSDAERKKRDQIFFLAAGGAGLLLILLATRRR